MTSPGDLPIPPAELRFMRETEESYLSLGRGLAELLFTQGLRPEASILDVGSGYGRLAVGLLADGRHRGTYLGFDILPRHVRWCRRNITTRASRLRFRHLDVHNARYNPAGAGDPDTARFPARTESIDLACAFSVFTHLYRSTIEHYLDELWRVLRPGGRAVTTWLLWDEGRLPAASGSASTYPLVFELDADTRYSDDTDPLRAIAFRTSLVRELIEARGFVVRSVELGSWDGGPGGAGGQFQDLVVFERPNPLLQRVRRRLGRLRRRLRRQVGR